MYKRRKVIKAECISGGVVLGKTMQVEPGRVTLSDRRIRQADLPTEIAALLQAVNDTVRDLQAMRESAGRKIGGPVARIFDAQLLIAQDQEFLRQVKEEIEESRRNAGYVYDLLVRRTTAPLKESSDEYMRQMAIDVEAVATKVLSNLAGYHEVRSTKRLPPHTILVSKTFTPNDIMAYRQRKAVGFVISEGGNNSHMALIARSLLLPILMIDKDALIQIPNDARIILDATECQVIVNPSERDWETWQRKKRRQGSTIISRIKKLDQIPPLTADGRPVKIAANISIPGMVDDILSERRIPIGLYRSEFLYLRQNGFPGEDEQYEQYLQIAEKYRDVSVVIRTFDLGQDKLIGNEDWPREANPALGYRGLRAMLEMPDVFKTQIRAILRASTRRNLKILLPMVTGLTEVERARKLIAQVKFRLKKQGVDFDPDIPLGIMIEVPAAAMTADKLAAKIDFMSIGTNDLTQYTLAADRTNNRVADLYNALHPAVLNLVRQTVEAGHRQGIPVSVCGELAGDPLALPLFIGLKVDCLSMSPNRIFDLCRRVSKIDSDLVKPLVESVLMSGSTESAVSKLQRYRKALEESKH